MRAEGGAATYIVNTSEAFDRWWAACDESLLCLSDVQRLDMRCMV
jgi:hypothetical protein